ncbi:hypothetical protein TNCV_539471 [Trichonephila clavipes]|nr:hypothetical protein TNCV_539471 [Trichonephila clavipes]
MGLLSCPLNFSTTLNRRLLLVEHFTCINLTGWTSFALGLIPSTGRIRSNSWDAQIPVTNDPRYARLETNLGIRQAKKGSNSFMTPLPLV